MKTSFSTFLAAALLSFGAIPGFALESLFLNDAKIPMRDGVNLAADIYVPSNRPAEKTGCILYFSPYQATKSDNPPSVASAEKTGLVQMNVDCRGLCHSEGLFEPWDRNFHEDAYDLLEWISSQPWSNGKVVMNGGSYCAATQLAAIRSGHKALAACAPSVVTFDPYPIYYSNGVLIPQFFKGWHTGLAGTNSWEEIARHPSSADPYWEAKRNLADFHKSSARAFYQAGWFDMLGVDTFNTFRLMPEGSFLRIGPWSHGVNTFDKPDVDYGQLGGAVTEDLETDFLHSALEGRAPATSSLPGPILMYVMGRNEWRYETEWPLERARPRKLYFTPEGGLQFDSPAQTLSEVAFSYDPANPVPSLGGRIIHAGGQYEQGEISKHPGVVSFTSAVLEEDLEVTGEVLAGFHATSSAPEADIAVKLVDVHPDGRAYNVVDGIARGAFSAGKGTSLTFRVDITSYVFLKGHRIRVDIAGSNSPHYEASKYQARTSFVTGGAQASWLELPTIPSGSIALAPLFRDGFVAPAGRDFTFSGRTLFNSPVTVTLPGRKYTTCSDSNGLFSVKIEALPVIREPFAITVADKATEFSITNCLSGFLILAGGQSNMEVPIRETENWREEVAKADRPAIREFKVGHEISFSPKRNCRGGWTSVTPATAGDIGAVGYFTAEYLQDALDGIPVGIINNSWSATPIQPWLPLDYLESDARFKGASLNAYRRWGHLSPGGLAEYRAALGRSFLVEDTGNEGEKLGWHMGPGDDWKEITLPGWLEPVYGESADGAFWFSREVEIDEEAAGADMEFRTTCIDDYDIAYFNGVKIGATGAETPDSYDVPRAYRVPAGIVKKGRNTIAIRVFDTAHAGGLPGEDLYLAAAGGRRIDLRGKWKTKDERIIKAKAWPPDYLPLVKIYHAASALYNAMVLPLKGMPVDAILWYQGESNAGSTLYGEQFKKLITVWRDHFGGQDVPFVFVQLAAFTKPPKDASDAGSWPVTRQQQELALELPAVRMTPAIDIGDAHRIHPLNKREIGRRNALWLLQDFIKPAGFTGKIEFPAVREVALLEGKIEISFSGAAGLRTTDGSAPAAFVVEKTESKRNVVCAYAKAEIVGEKIVLTIPEGFGEVSAVRYGWHMNPEVNTVNGLGFPMLPFRKEVQAPAQ